MIPVILDTNAALLPFTQRTRIEEVLEGFLGAHTIHIPSSVIVELQNLSKNQGEIGRAARMAVTWCRRFDVQPTGLMGDDGLLQVARKIQAVVVTNDRKLQTECIRSGLRVLVARQDGLSWFKAGSG